MIRLEGVNKRFYPGEAREVHALRDIKLEIAAGEFSVITGPSGCGKTTLLNAIGLLDSISSGAILLEGKNISSLGEQEKTLLRRDAMGFVFQAYNLVPVLSARENIGFIMKLQGRRRSMSASKRWRVFFKSATISMPSPRSSAAVSSSALPSPAPSPPNRASFWRMSPLPISIRKTPSTLWP